MFRVDSEAIVAANHDIDERNAALQADYQRAVALDNTVPEPVYEVVRPMPAARGYAAMVCFVFVFGALV